MAADEFVASSSDHNSPNERPDPILIAALSEWASSEHESAKAYLQQIEQLEELYVAERILEETPFAVEAEPAMAE